MQQLAAGLSVSSGLLTIHIGHRVFHGEFLAVEVGIEPLDLLEGEGDEIEEPVEELESDAGKHFQ